MGTNALPGCMTSVSDSLGSNFTFVQDRLLLPSLPITNYYWFPVTLVLAVKPEGSSKLLLLYNHYVICTLHMQRMFCHL